MPSIATSGRVTSHELCNRRYAAGTRTNPIYLIYQFSITLAFLPFLRAITGTGIALLSHRNSVCLTVCHTGESVTNSGS